MLKELKVESNITYTENGALSNRSSYDDCLDLFAVSGALRNADPKRIEKLLLRAYCSNPDIALRIVFYTRDVRGGLGERKIFRHMLKFLSEQFPDSIIRNMQNIPEYGRFDDMMVLFDTPCESKMISFINQQLYQDWLCMQEEKNVSLLAKWLPSVNATNTENKLCAKRLARALKMSDKDYRKKLSKLKAYIDILETRLCNKDYTFDYEKQPSNAMFKYRRAFYRNDTDRYIEYMNMVSQGKAKLNTGTLFPYEIIRSALTTNDCLQKQVMDTTWKALPNYCDGRNALAVIDGSGSMYGYNALPILIAVSLGIYFAEHNTGHFKNHFITFSETPRLIEIKGNNISEKSNYCMSYNEVANTDLYNTFAMILSVAVRNKLPQEELPEVLYIISDMEFDAGVNEDKTVFQDAKEMYESYGYTLPKIVYWNVCSHSEQLPVTKDENGTVLLSGASPKLFEMAISGDLNPYKLMLDVVNSDRYKAICA